MKKQFTLTKVSKLRPDVNKRIKKNSGVNIIIKMPITPHILTQPC
jgi:hypothetical protein